jgi:GT2 family glycosyltransferase
MIKIPSIVVLMTSFNRREKTLKALASLAAQTANIPRQLKVLLVDDGSSDGTSDAVISKFPEVQVIRGSGSLYWNGGMRLAFDHALRVGFDGYIWLNDDTELSPDAVDILLQTEQRLRDGGVVSIVTASICDPITGKRTYGGLRRVPRLYRYDHIAVQPSPGEPVSCDSMNGNCTLIPADVANRLGNLEARFQHHFGDVDYGYRAKQAGYSVYTAPGFLGTCPRNPIEGTWRDRTASVARRWKDVMSIKGYRFGEWLFFTRRHYSYLWPLYFLVPYIKSSLPSRASNGPNTEI